MREQTLLKRPTLVLNRSWHAVCTTTVRHAIILVCRERAKIIATDTFELHDLDSWCSLAALASGPLIHGVSMAIPLPEVVILTQHAHTPQPRVVFSRRNIFKRDRYTCQFCGNRPALPDLTIDHVLPRSRGGHSSWENCVVSCRTCNESKGHRTPAEAGLHLRIQPRRPDWLPFVAYTSTIPASWEKFIGELYWNVELDQSGD